MDRHGLLAAAAGAAAAVVLGRSIASAYRFETSMLTLAHPAVRAPLRIAFLTDLHYGTFQREGSLKAWIDATIALEPDLVLIGGDLVDIDARADLTPLPRELARLAPPLGTWAVWGNHDHHRYRDLEPFRRQMAEAGVEVLRNDGRLVRADVYVAGVDDLREGNPDLARALAGRPLDAATVLVSHNPDILPDVPEDVALTLAGHTHGGQVVIPGFGPPFTSSAYGRRFASGWVAGPALGYVSRGLGVSWLPLRFGCPAELVVLDLRPSAGRPAS